MLEEGGLLSGSFSIIPNFNFRIGQCPGGCFNVLQMLSTVLLAFPAFRLRVVKVGDFHSSADTLVF